MNIQENVTAVQERIKAAALRVGRQPEEITLVAATKNQSSDTIRAVIAAGVSVCGENRVQEMTAHLEDNAYTGARLHMIGRLQTNKVKQVVGRVDLIESVDSLRLLETVEKYAARLELVQDILLEVNIAAEQSKGGLPPEQALELALKCAQMPHVRLRGLMCIPPAAAPGGSNRKFFAQTRQLFVDIRQKMSDNNTDVNCLSMGMSGDFEDAVEEGATLVRVGTALFGPRPPAAGLH
ncbi:MAG: YggS family pyridoxal phosphate-dependent enzyme [Oscillospiraceae bacterium]|nr:YggS family pyridoxal phosphate-dependent enzyme [Oscillospiraceae bacterium]